MVVFGVFDDFVVFDVDSENGDEDGAADPAGENGVEGRHFGTVAGDGVDFNFVRLYGGGNEVGDSARVVLEEIDDILENFAVLDGIYHVDGGVDVRLEIGENWVETLAELSAAI